MPHKHSLFAAHRLAFQHGAPAEHGNVNDGGGERAVEADATGRVEEMAKRLSATDITRVAESVSARTGAARMRHVIETFMNSSVPVYLEERFKLAKQCAPMLRTDDDYIDAFLDANEVNDDMQTVYSRVFDQAPERFAKAVGAILNRTAFNEKRMQRMPIVESQGFEEFMEDYFRNVNLTDPSQLLQIYRVPNIGTRMQELIAIRLWGSPAGLTTILQAMSLPDVHVLLQMAGTSRVAVGFPDEAKREQFNTAFRKAKDATTKRNLVQLAMILGRETALQQQDTRPREGEEPSRDWLNLVSEEDIATLRRDPQLQTPNDARALDELAQYQFSPERLEALAKTINAQTDGDARRQASMHYLNYVDLHGDDIAKAVSEEYLEGAITTIIRLGESPIPSIRGAARTSALRLITVCTKRATMDQNDKIQRGAASRAEEQLITRLFPAMQRLLAGMQPGDGLPVMSREMQDAVLTSLSYEAVYKERYTPEQLLIVINTKVALSPGQSIKPLRTDLVSIRNKLEVRAKYSALTPAQKALLSRVQELLNKEES